ncbi:MAG: WbuC family cupin fold metalloprotein [Planctomycetes bacterium]|nr:WbuC family cupin fold metalloprotein [Planctomycetota bacterium]
MLVLGRAHAAARLDSAAREPLLRTSPSLEPRPRDRTQRPTAHRLRSGDPLDLSSRVPPPHPRWNVSDLLDPSNAPTSTIRCVARGDLDALSAEAVAAERRRAHRLLHPSPEAAVQRFFLALEPGTYVRPHRHSEAHKWELFVVLRGRLDLLVFTADGELRERLVLAPDATTAVEIPPGIFHAYVCREPGTIGFEVKEGAYIATAAHDFAAWAPPERSPGAAAFERWMRDAEPSARAPHGSDAARLEDGGRP